LYDCCGDLRRARIGHELKLADYRLPRIIITCGPQALQETLMNQALEQLTKEIGLAAPEKEPLRLAFSLACATRVRHLLEDACIIDCLDALAHYVEGRLDRAALAHFQSEAARLANQHRGSKSIDGCGHAAVSASYAVANALNGKALEAASYAAYAIVYAEGGYAAVAERVAFEAEFSWQLATLAALATQVPGRC